MKRIAIIPARGGSRRIPGKNIKEFHGKPILAYSILTALQSDLFDSVAVCTDDPQIHAVAEHYGAWHITRSKYHAQDEVGTQEVMRHALRMAMAIKDTRWDQACCIYATCPMMTSADLHWGLGMLNAGHQYAFAVAAEPFGPAGMFYWGYAGAFLEKAPLVHPGSAIIPIPAHRCIDINTPEDWDRAEAMYTAWVEKGKPQ